ncbi:hypothetical protein GCM10023143_08990 [Compostibacter hankyongensis]|uniref:PKD domain-containing protein n=2 Tax=Compostibacter hankyongensis TaxID=1007089 RepID=A0ABP8FIQ0_9BACT
MKAIRQLGTENGFDVDTTTDAAKFTEDTLKQYTAVVFMSTTGDVLDDRQQADFERYIQAGGGYLGVHAAADCEYHWPWYGKLVGAYFKSHPRQQQATLHIHKDAKFPVTDSLPDPWTRKDEWYNFRQPPTDVHVLVSIDEKSYEGGENGDNHPMVWYHEYDGGRAFYMELGHTNESYTEPNFLKLLLAGLKYAISKNEELDYRKATSLRIPDEDRFAKEFLGGGLDEPTELTVLPNLDILIGERKGQIMFYNAAQKKMSQVAELKVYSKALHVKGVNVETGLMGLQADPQYEKNHWIYVYYSPVDKSVDRLSRFKFENNTFNLQSEQTILEVNTNREICCHTGGSIAFDGEGNLYLSVGDNTTPFDEKDTVTGKGFPVNLHGFSPLDDRPGYEHYDDRRAAGNSNDLRGKILRIKVHEDGTYEIPKGNLFPEGTAKTRPEIYVMGDRNPYRISVDKHNGYLYWGEVGPDAGNDSLETRGPRGYDEVNQARKAGNFGWPYFVGNNYPYHQYDYATGTPGPAFDPEHVVNNSRNNTGIRDLPPAQPAFIWYPYAASPDFPQVGQGGRTAMAGPVYYVNDYPKETRLPDYYDGKFFAYDWIRNWIKVVTMDKEGNLQKIEPFMPHEKFNNISDMEVGKDGRIYIVEYGKGWFAKNPDAGLYVITYNGGNRPPEASLEVNKKAGALPFAVHASVKANDPDGDSLTYHWQLGDQVKRDTKTPELDYTFQNPGTYPVSVSVEDTHGASVKSSAITVYAGNEAPQVDLQVKGNPSFYFPGKPVAYAVTVQDKEDGSTEAGNLDLSRLLVRADYLESPDKAALPVGHEAAMVAGVSGKSIMESLDCQSCHKVDTTSVGPAFMRVAEKYKSDPKAEDYLAHKIIKGGSGVWGEVAMAAHPNLSVDDAEKIVSWILSLADERAAGPSLPPSGTVNPGQFKLTDQGVLMISAAYTDKGGNQVPPLTGRSTVVLQNPYLSATDAKSSGFSDQKMGDLQFAALNGAKGWLSFRKISLQDIHTVEIRYGVDTAVAQGWQLELHLDKPDGPLAGQVTLGPGASAKKPVTATLTLGDAAGNAPHDLYFVVQKKEASEKGRLGIVGMRFR